MAKKNNTKEKKDSGDGIKLVARNKRAFHNYEVISKLECGIALQGTEVKSLRDGHVTFGDSYANVRDDELFLIGLTVSEYSHGNRLNHTPTSNRKLLAHKRQIRKLRSQIEEKGLTIVPLSIYFLRGKAKVEIGVVRGKAQYDKRNTLKDREISRIRERTLKRH
ncbi:MAG: SsrA-binding protein SmpB [Planctomycetes bacterium]|nr:SsrA-binding protein SmpB [Planctomycetota bacterium]